MFVLSLEVKFMFEETIRQPKPAVLITSAVGCLAFWFIVAVMTAGWDD